MQYPMNQIDTLSDEQLESVAETPLEHALIAMLGERLSPDGHDEAVEEAITEAKAPLEVELARYKYFFSNVVAGLEWPAAEPDDDTLVQAINDDLGRAEELRELVKDFKGAGFTGNSDTYVTEQHALAVLVNHWDTIQDAFVEPEVVPLPNDRK